MRKLFRMVCAAGFIIIYICTLVMVMFMLVLEGSYVLAPKSHVYKYTLQDKVGSDGEIKSTFSLNAGIEHAKLIRILDEAGPNDTVIVTVRSFGGSMIGGAILATAITNSKATTRLKVDGYAYSMGAKLLCVGDEVEISKYAKILIHLPRTSAGVFDDPKTIDGQLAERLLSNCKKLFTAKQLKRYYNREDVFIDPLQFKHYKGGR